jgi:hypothetical protein
MDIAVYQFITTIPHNDNHAYIQRVPDREHPLPDFLQTRSYVQSQVQALLRSARYVSHNPENQVICMHTVRSASHVPRKRLCLRPRKLPIKPLTLRARP